MHGKNNFAKIVNRLLVLKLFQLLNGDLISKKILALRAQIYQTLIWTAIREVSVHTHANDSQTSRFVDTTSRNLCKLCMLCYVMVLQKPNYRSLNPKYRPFRTIDLQNPNKRSPKSEQKISKIRTINSHFSSISSSTWIDLRCSPHPKMTIYMTEKYLFWLWDIHLFVKLWKIKSSFQYVDIMGYFE